MSISETFHGYIETTQDSLLVLEACRRNILPKISRRLQDKERKLVRSGSVFVFDEHDSGIKRWTDGLIWSPSRILGNFLIYRELDNKKSTKKRLSTSKIVDNSNNNGGGRMRQRTTSLTNSESSFDQNTFQRNRERQLVGSLSESFNFKPNGLIKKTMSIVVHGAPLHLVSYYHPDDVLERQLRTPSVVPELANLEISPELLSRQNFRIPPMIEPDSYDNNNNNNNNNSYSFSTNKLFTNPYTLPTPTQSTPNTPLPTSPLSHYHSISTPMKSRLSSNLISNSTTINDAITTSTTPLLGIYRNHPMNDTFPTYYSSNPNIPSILQNENSWDSNSRIP